MDFFIKKIFDGKADELVHLQFQKFSRGKFDFKAMAKAKNSKGVYNIGTTYEYANELVRAVAEKLGSNKAKVTGAIISTRDLSNEIKFESKKQFMGVKQYVINTELTGKEIIDLCEKLPTSFFALTFNAGDTELKIRAKAPKSAKPSTKADKKPEADFCKIKTSDKNIARAMLFDVDLEKFKQAEIEHSFLIEDIEIDRTIKDPNEMREKAKRKGKVIRTTVVDGNTVKEEKTFTA